MCVVNVVIFHNCGKFPRQFPQLWLFSMTISTIVVIFHEIFHDGGDFPHAERPTQCMKQDLKGGTLSQMSLQPTDYCLCTVIQDRSLGNFYLVFFFSFSYSTIISRKKKQISQISQISRHWSLQSRTLARFEKCEIFRTPIFLAD